MRNRFIPVAAFAILQAISACDHDRGSVSEGLIAPDEEIVESISSRDGEVDLVLTPDLVYMRLSEEALAKIKEEFEQERQDAEDSKLANTIKSVILDNVESMLNQRIEYWIDDIDDMYWDDGTLVIDIEDEKMISFGDVEIDDRAALESFDEDDALAFIAAFKTLKSGR